MPFVFLGSTRFPGRPACQEKKTRESAFVTRLASSLADNGSHKIDPPPFCLQGYIQNSEIDGTIQMKSYLSGTPEIRLALNEDLAIGKEFGGTGDLGMVLLDDCNFHESVRLDSFDVDRTLVLVSGTGVHCSCCGA